MRERKKIVIKENRKHILETNSKFIEKTYYEKINGTEDFINDLKSVYDII